MARIFPVAAALDVAAPVDGDAGFTSLLYRLWLAAPRAALPLLPITQEAHLFVQTCLFDQGVEFGAGEALANWLGAVGDTPDCQRGDHRVYFQLALVHFVESV